MLNQLAQDYYQAHRDNANPAKLRSIMNKMTDHVGVGEEYRISVVGVSTSANKNIVIRRPPTGFREPGLKVFLEERI